MYVCLCVRVCMCVCVCARARTHMCMYVSMYLCSSKRKDRACNAQHLENGSKLLFGRVLACRLFST